VSARSLWLDRLESRWPVGRIKDHVSLVNGFPFDSHSFNDSKGTRLVRIRDLTAGGGLTYVDTEVTSPTVMIDSGDLIVGMDGDFSTGIWKGGPAALNQRLCVLRTRPTLNQRFLSHLLPMPLKAINDVTYFTTVKHLSSHELLDERIPLPPLDTQTAVANYLDQETARIDSLITAKRRMVSLVDERWETVIRDAAAGKLVAHRSSRRESRLPWLKDVPAHWREGQLKLIAKLGTGHTPSRSRPEWWVNPPIPWITTGEVAQMRSDRIEHIAETREQISEAGMANSSAELHPAGTVVLSRTASVGYSAIMGRDMATSQDFATWTCGPLIKPRFLLLCLRAMRQDLLGRLAMGSTHKTIYMPDLESIMVPLPPLPEQEELVEAAYDQQSTLDACATRISAQIDLLRERRKAVITSAVTGRLDMPAAA
jgi:type I restriction enzyme S subunit